MMRIVFFGASALGYSCCEHLMDLGHEVVGIFTMPQEFNISYSPEKRVKNVLHKAMMDFIPAKLAAQKARILCA